MTDNVVSLEEKRLERLDGTLFGSTNGELQIAALTSQVEFARNELKTVQAYIDLSYAGEISMKMGDGSEPPSGCFAHLGSVLSNYEQLLFDQIAVLEYGLEMLNSSSDDHEH
jgi:hypothetical protein